MVNNNYNYNALVKVSSPFLDLKKLHDNLIGMLLLM